MDPFISDVAKSFARDLDTLIESITTQLWPLGDDVTFVPGHGPTSTFGEGRASNPYVGDAALAR